MGWRMLVCSYAPSASDTESPVLRLPKSLTEAVGFTVLLVQALDSDQLAGRRIGSLHRYFL